MSRWSWLTRCEATGGRHSAWKVKALSAQGSTRGLCPCSDCEGRCYPIPPARRPEASTRVTPTCTVRGKTVASETLKDYLGMPSRVTSRWCSQRSSRVEKWRQTRVGPMGSRATALSIYPARQALDSGATMWDAAQ